MIRQIIKKIVLLAAIIVIVANITTTFKLALLLYAGVGVGVVLMYLIGKLLDW
jgi:hypothetical protein